MGISEGIVIALISFLGGALGSVVAPWVNWGIERRKLRLQARRALISRWRNYFDMVEDLSGFTGSVIYSEMRPHMDEATAKMLHGGTVVLTIGRSGDVIRNHLYDAVADIEAKWGLV